MQPRLPPASSTTMPSKSGARPDASACASCRSAPAASTARASRDRVSGVSTVEISATAAPLPPTAASIFGRKRPQPVADRLAALRRARPGACCGAKNPTRAEAPRPATWKRAAQPVAGRRRCDRQRRRKAPRGEPPDPLHRRRGRASVSIRAPSPASRCAQSHPAQPPAWPPPRGPGRPAITSVARPFQNRRRASTTSASTSSPGSAPATNPTPSADRAMPSAGRSEARDALDAPAHALSLSRTGGERLEKRQAGQLQALAQEPSRERPLGPRGRSPRPFGREAPRAGRAIFGRSLPALPPEGRRRAAEASLRSRRASDSSTSSGARRPLRQALERAPRAFDRLASRSGRRRFASARAVRPGPRGPRARRRPSPVRNRVPRRPPPGAPRRRARHPGSTRAS